MDTSEMIVQAIFLILYLFISPEPPEVFWFIKSLDLLLTFLKVDQCQPHENFWTACHSSQVVLWVKIKPMLAGNQIPFRGTDLVLYCVGVYKRSYRHLYTVKNQVGSSERNLISC